jgi:hypothetical protein
MTFGQLFVAWIIVNGIIACLMMMDRTPKRRRR